MRNLLEVCCGLDVHKEVLVACMLRGGIDEEPEPIIKEFSTLLCGLDEFKRWLVENDCHEVAMESTGVYWYPIYNVLESIIYEDTHVNIIVANPHHMKNVPGKKTDIKDAHWIATLLRAGLLAPSYIPPKEIRELRDWTRYRDILIKELVGHKNRIEKHLQQCGFKLSTILTDIFGMSGTMLIQRLCQKGKLSETDVIVCLQGTLKNKSIEVQQAVAGQLSEHDRGFLTNLVKVMGNCQREIEEVEWQITDFANKYEPTLRLLETVPAIQRRASTIIVSELGTDLSMFPTAGHLCKWAGLCPGDNESAGKKKSTRVTKGNPRIKSVMVQCAWAATRCKNTFLRDWFYKLRTRRGTKKALIAVARKLLSIAWQILTSGEIYKETRYEETRKKEEERRKQKLKAEATKLGFKLVPV
jgi:transposase